MPKQSAEYYRNYRATKAEMQEHKEAELKRDGINRCVAYMRNKVAGQAITGYQAALMIERAMLEIELEESAMRKRFIEQLQMR